MRVTAILVALFIVLAWVSATSVCAQTGQGFREPNAAAKGGTMAPPAKSTKPKGPKRPNRGEVGTTGVPLTDKECTTLGGKVFNTPASQGVCNSGKYCERMDQNKVKHAVCISAR